MRLSVLLGSTLLAGALALPALAQTTPAAPATAAPAPVTPPPAAAMSAAPAAVAPAAPAPDQVEAARQRTASADRDAMFEAHLAGLHAGLTLTRDQERMWPAVEQAVRGMRTMRADMRERHDAMAKDHDEADKDPMALLKAYSDGLLTRGQALKALSDAASPLYASLSDDQKHRLPMLLHGLTPDRGPLARMIDRLGNEDNGPDAAMSEDSGPRAPRGERERWGWRGDRESRGWDHHGEANDDRGAWRHHRQWDDRGESRGEDDDHAMD